jgi:hypothetical protein
MPSGELEDADKSQTIILCGGLGESKYVFNRLKLFIDSFFGEGKVRLVNPPRAWSAVARGAAMHALREKSVMYRRSRDHIGMVVHCDFQPEVHRCEDKFFCPIMKVYRAKNQMKWLIKKGSRPIFSSRQS